MLMRKSPVCKSVTVTTPPATDNFSHETIITYESNDSFTLPNLDINYLMKSALALSAEIDLEQLLQKIMTVVLECSGAQHGYLLIKEQMS